MVYNKLFRKLEGYTLKPTKFKRFLYWFLAPYFMILERRCKKGIWDNLIVKELITNDVVFEWLDNNDFEFRNNVFKSADLLENHPFFDRPNLEDAKALIQKEFVESMTKLFKENISFDVENYVTLLVETEVKTVYHEESDKYFYSRIYTVILQFCRQYFYDICKKNTKIWFVVFSLITILIIFLFLFIL